MCTKYWICRWSVLENNTYYQGWNWGETPNCPRFYKQQIWKSANSTLRAWCSISGSFLAKVCSTPQFATHKNRCSIQTEIFMLVLLNVSVKLKLLFYACTYIETVQTTHSPVYQVSWLNIQNNVNIWRPFKHKVIGSLLIFWRAYYYYYFGSKYLNRI